MFHDVKIVIAPVGDTFDVLIERRTRKSFREGMEKLSATLTRDPGVFQALPLVSLSAAKELIATEYPDWRVKVVDNRVEFLGAECKVGWTDMWVAGDYVGSRHTYGYVGTRRVFEIRRLIVRRDDPDKYELVWTFGDGPLAVSEDTDQLMRFAERQFDRFLRSIGAKFVGVM